jgi:hypothetical protein
VTGRLEHCGHYKKGKCDAEAAPRPPRPARANHMAYSDRESGEDYGADKRVETKFHRSHDPALAEKAGAFKRRVL